MKYNYDKALNMTPEDLKKAQWSKGWALSAVGAVVYVILKVFVKPKDYKGICPYFEIGKSWGGLEMGWFFICSKNASEETKMHEVGHSLQNATFGGFKMLGLSIISACRYWKRVLFGAKTAYDSWWFEGDASKIGKKYIEKFGGNEDEQ